MEASQIANRRELAMLDFEDGLVTDAESSLNEIIKKLDDPSDPQLAYELCQSLLGRAQILTYANRWEEALDDLQRCAAAAKKVGFSEHFVLINVYQQRAKLYSAPFSNIYDPAAARTALSELESLGLTNWWLGNSLADLAYQEKDWLKAAEEYRKLAKELNREGWLRGAAATRGRAGRALIELGEWDAAQVEVTAALEFFTKYGPQDLLAESQIQMARILSSRGDNARAWGMANEALALVETGIRHFRALFEQQRFLVNKLACYQHAFAIGLAHGGEVRSRHAWTIAERAKSFYLCQLVANADIGLFDGVDAADLARLRDLELDLDRFESSLQLSSAGQDNEHRRLEEQLRQASAEKEKLQEKMMRTNPRWAALRTPPPFDLVAQIEKLDRSWIPLSFFWQPANEGATLHIFLAGHDRKPVHHATTWSKAELAQLEEARGHLRGRVFPGARIFPDGLARKILPDSVISAIGSGTRLLISPHEHLRSMPLHALPIGEAELLIDRCPVQYIPTLALLPLSKHEREAEKVLLLGCAENDFKDPILKEVPDEIEALSDLWSAARPSKVTKRLIAREQSPSDAGVPLDIWGEFDVIHIACHGVFPETRPLDAALRLGNDNIRTSEMFGVRLKANLTCLSACSLGRQTTSLSGVQLVGDEWVGFYLPLFYAGTRAVLVSLWDANSRVASAFMKTLHGALSEGKSSADAFQIAALSVKSKPGPLWANWYLVGFPN